MSVGARRGAEREGLGTPGSGLPGRPRNDSRTALGPEWVPRVHFHLEQAEWPAGMEGVIDQELQRGVRR